MTQITGLLIPVEGGSGYTAIVAEFPGIIAEGQTKEEAKQNLMDNFHLVMEHKRQEMYKSYGEKLESFALA